MLAGRIAAIHRYPVKGFSPEPLASVALQPGRGLPWDRAFAVEDGPSGFDPEAPAHLSKMKFTVLAKTPALARVRTRYEESTETLEVALEGEAAGFRLGEEAGRAAFAAWLAARFAADIRGPLRVLAAPEGHRFYDHPEGALSLINLASVADLAARLGRPLDPLRFRANFHVEGWPAWAELELVGQRLRLGEAAAEVFAATERCAATHVDLASGVRDVELVPALWEAYGHKLCGVYLQVLAAGEARLGAEVGLA